jgi:hypothetical protein
MAKARTEFMIRCGSAGQSAPAPRGPFQRSGPTPDSPPLVRGPPGMFATIVSIRDREIKNSPPARFFGEEGWIGTSLGFPCEMWQTVGRQERAPRINAQGRSTDV